MGTPCRQRRRRVAKRCVVATFREADVAGHEHPGSLPAQRGGRAGKCVLLQTRNRLLDRLSIDAGA
jgi:hypothetical protein